MNERYCETNVEFLLNLKNVFDEPTTFFTMDTVKLTFYRERDVYFVGYEKEE